MEMVSGVQHRTTDASQDSVERNNLSAPMEENDTKSLSQINLGEGQGNGDVVEAQPLHAHADDALRQQDTSPGIEESDSPRSERTRPSLVVEPDSANAVDRVHTPNIIIFGEAGVGKSSVINLIAGQKRAHISNDALGCTFEYQRHNVKLNGMPFALWDTTGLDEGSEGTVPARQAESNLRVLMQRLAHSGGIHLVIYCIRGTRLTKALKRNYDLFYVTVCRKKVPVALVVTGLEHQEGEIETWWTTNEASLRRNGMRFDAHACVTTLDVDDAVIRARRSDSQRRLQNLLVEYAARRPWKVETSSISWSMFRNILRGGSSTRKKTTQRVVIYDGTASRRTRTRLIGDRQLEYELVYVDKPFTPPPSGKLAGVLVFYTSTLLGTRIPPDDVASLRVFYDVAGGKTCPVVVVLRGCNDDQVAQMCWDAVAPCYSDIHAWPIVDEQSKLDALIEKRCIEHVEVRTSRLHRAYEAIMELFSAVLRWQDSLVVYLVPDAHEYAILRGSVLTGIMAHVDNVI
ncbi:hypothetical protein OG21DRAFT_1487098 [Imleria badia]|nr:hypothetical protein OG21DRAFT_1487098 [Imleria badia]